VLKGSPAHALLAAIDDVLKGRPHLAPELAALVAGLGPAPAGGLAALSPRERQVVLGVVRGLSSSAIGAQLQLSPKTVDSYRSRLMAKLGAADVPALVRLAVREGWIGVADA
jgi:DNA-binding NarL/FixJ family response regulator